MKKSPPVTPTPTILAKTEIQNGKVIYYRKTDSGNYETTSKDYLDKQQTQGIHIFWNEEDYQIKL